MLYVNVYLVTQCYGGCEEGGWYFDASQPLASIPIDSDYIPGQEYYCEDGHIHIRACTTCSGTGEVDKEADYIEPGQTEPTVYKARCEDCGEIPTSIIAAEKLMSDMDHMFKDTPNRYHHEHIRVALEDHFAVAFPDRKPHYE
jgi:hypothetical protein